MPKVNNKVWAVIPTLFPKHYLNKCLQALLAGTEVPEKIFVIDNSRSLIEIHGIEVVRPERPLSVAASWNLIGRQAGNKDLLVLNDDCFVGETTLELLSATKGSLIIAGGYHCFLWREQTRKVIGLFDERFDPAYYEDTDYWYRCKLAGIPNTEISTPGIVHVGNGTLTAMINTVKERVNEKIMLCCQLYKDKWGGFPLEETVFQATPEQLVIEANMSHAAQMLFIAKTASLFPAYFNDCRVLELGSRNINGTVRDFFSGCDYVGVDYSPGPLVDVQCLFHEYRSDRLFNTIISCEAFEHDPYIEQSLDNALSLLKPGGLFVATWASPLRGEHGTERTGEIYSPDPTYYRGLSPGEVLGIVSGRLFPCSTQLGNNKEDVYLLGFKKD